MSEDKKGAVSGRRGAKVRANLTNPFAKRVVDAPRVGGGPALPGLRPVSVPPLTESQRALAEDFETRLSKIIDRISAVSHVLSQHYEPGAVLADRDELSSPVLDDASYRQAIATSQEVAKAAMVHEMMDFFELPMEDVKVVMPELFRRLAGL